MSNDTTNNLIKKRWFRIFISLVIGGVSQELIHILTGPANRPEVANLSLLYALVVYILLSYYNKKSLY